MIHRKLNSLILAAACTFAIVSCKDDDSSSGTVLPSLDGNLNFHVPEYVQQNAKVRMTPGGAIHPDGEELGYCWKVITPMPALDTTRYETGLDYYGNPSDGSFEYQFPDTLKTYDVVCYAFATGYSASSKTKYVTVVKGGIDGSITGLELASRQTVTIDGKVYPYVTIDDIDWMCSNLGTSSAGTPYANCKAMSDVFGRFYSYEEALTICPEGWELPTDADWTALAKAAGATDADEVHSDIKGVAAAIMGNGYFNDKRLWEFWPTIGDITNSTGMSIIPVGYAMLNAKADEVKEDPFIDYTYPNAQFKGFEDYAAFWTADKVENEEGMAYYRYLISEQPDLIIGKTSTTSFGASVRCIRRK